MRQGIPFARMTGFPVNFLVFAALAAALAPIAALLLTVDPSAFLSSLIAAPRDGRMLSALRYTLLQSSASCAAALLFGLPGAWLYARYRFAGRRMLMALSAVPFCVPPVLVILAFVVYFGRAGFVNRFLMGTFGLSEPPLAFLYSFQGIVLVHAFYNFPIILQIVGSTWTRLPVTKENAARVLGAGRIEAFRTGTLPSLAPAIGQAASLVFLFCFFSFSVVLVFGGLSGSTLEVEVYRRARLEVDPAGAAALALIETVFALASVGVFSFFEKRSAANSRNAGAETELKHPKGIVRAALVLYLIFIAVFFMGPIVSLIAQSFKMTTGWDTNSGFGPGNFIRLLSGPKPLLTRALGHTMRTAIPASLIATVAGVIVAYARNGSRGSTAQRALLELTGSIPLAVSGVISALGWIVLFPDGGITAIICAQAAMAFPFVLRSMTGALASLEKGPRLAARSLGASPLSVLLTVDLPAVWPTLAASAAFAVSMAAGDVNAPLVLGARDFQPLSLLLYRLIGSYRFSEACAAGLVLAVITGAVFFIKERTSDAA